MKTCRVQHSKWNTGLAVVLVIVKSGEKSVATHALLDSGSTACFCQESLVQKLGLKNKSKKKLSLTTVCKDQVEIDSQIITGLEVGDLDGQHTLQLPAVYSLEKVPVDANDIPRQKHVSHWPYLSGVSLPSLEAPVELMIGSNVPLAMEPWEIIHSQGGGPFATRTLLGWVINGPVQHDGRGLVKANRIKVENAEEIEDMMSKMHNAEFSEKLSDSSKGPSIEDKMWQKVDESIKFTEGHYEIGLPLRDKDTQMPSNRNMALRRLSTLQKKMDKQPKFREDYTTFMDKVLEEGYAEEVSEESRGRADGLVWYMPHHGVYNPHKPDKIRVVFDCAAKYDGVSLNDKLLQGPDLTNSLVGVLIRFRQEPVAFMADMKSMFYQVKVPESGRDLLRFLWRPGGDINEQPKEFDMTVHIFGAVSSSSCSNFALRRTLEDHHDDFSEKALETLKKAFYVDDCLQSVSSIETAQPLASEVQALCAKGGFHLHKYVSNREGVLDKIPKEDRDEDSSKKGLYLEEATSVKKVLGIKWNLDQDTFSFSGRAREMKVTRREILSVISGVFSPWVS